MAAIADSISSLVQGSRVWYKNDRDRWESGFLDSFNGNACVLILESGVRVSAPGNRVQPANPTELDTLNDLCQISYLNEPSVLQVLKTRQAQDSIYTFAGPVLVALNPCKKLPLYTPEVAAMYAQTEGRRAGSKRDLQYGSSVPDPEIHATVPPHVYSVAAAAFRAMVRDGKSQSIIVSGESGAGKTETTKIALQFFATLAGSGGDGGVEEKVLATTPVLEAFGNAKTLRNPNSSRFGKLIQIHFNHTNHICGCSIKTYLLEKSRVVTQLPGERSYHIFYQLVRGSTPEERSALHLPSDPEEFKYLARSGCVDIAGVDDAKEFATVRAALTGLVSGGDAVMQCLTRLLAGILWLGNVEFERCGDETTRVAEGTASALNFASELIGVSAENLSAALTTTKFKVNGEEVTKNNSLAEACGARDALAKSVYSLIFNWLVEQINRHLSAGRRSSGISISILDIFGFENFEMNSFEQLCINFTNERLQQQFNKHVFQLQQAEYAEEGICDVTVEWSDNTSIVRVIEASKGQGILSVMDAQAKFPNATDLNLLEAVKKIPSAGPVSNVITFNPRRPNIFGISHYAGLVEYDVQGMLEKTRDTLSNDIVCVMSESTNLFLLAELTSEFNDDGDDGDDLSPDQPPPLPAQTLLPSSTISSFSSIQVSYPMSAARSSKTTLGVRFASQLRELVTDLDKTDLHFIRCIKPNATITPNVFDQALVLDQLRCCGVLEVVRISKIGFTSRMPCEKFVSRYHVVASPDEDLLAIMDDETPQDATKRMLAALKVAPDEYMFGRTKVFFRPGVLGRIDDSWAHMMRLVARLQTQTRCWKWRTWFAAQRRAATTIQAAMRARLAERALVAARIEALRMGEDNEVQGKEDAAEGGLPATPLPEPVLEHQSEKESEPEPETISLQQFQLPPMMSSTIVQSSKGAKARARTRPGTTANGMIYVYPAGWWQKKMIQFIKRMFGI